LKSCLTNKSTSKTSLSKCWTKWLPQTLLTESDVTIFHSP
jgi:hypothetical protein